MKKVLLIILGLIIAVVIDVSIGYYLQSYEYAGIIVVPYVILILISIFDEPEGEKNK